MAISEQVGNATLETLSPNEVKERFDRNEIVLLDVRTPQEYAFEHIPGAMLLPMAFFDPAKLPMQDEKPIVLHCGSGIRSRKMAEKCIAAGFDKIAHMDGGFGAWKGSGLSYVAIDPASGACVNRN